VIGNSSLCRVLLNALAVLLFSCRWWHMLALAFL
jgi:hypothetical protein